MQSLYSYVVSQEKLDPSEGIELSGEGVIQEVEKMKDDDLKEITRQIKEAQKLAEAVDKDEPFDDDKSEDWVPSKGVFKGGCKRISLYFVCGDM